MKSQDLSPQIRGVPSLVGKSETHARLAAGGMLKVKAWSLVLRTLGTRSSHFREQSAFRAHAKDGYPDPGGEWGLVALPVFKTGEASKGAWRVRFPSASAEQGKR